MSQTQNDEPEPLKERVRQVFETLTHPQPYAEGPLLNAQMAVFKALPALYSMENTPNPPCPLRLYDVAGDWVWYPIEFDGSDIFFGLVCGFEEEIGYFSLSEFLTLDLPHRIAIDPSFKPVHLHDLHPVSPTHSDTTEETP